MQVIAHLEPLQQRYSSIMADEGYLDSILAQGAGRLSIMFPSACTALLLSNSWSIFADMEAFCDDWSDIL